MARRRVLTPAEIEEAQARASSPEGTSPRRRASVLGRLRVRRSAGEDHTSAAPARSGGTPAPRVETAASSAETQAASPAPPRAVTQPRPRPSTAARVPSPVQPAPTPPSVRPVAAEDSVSDEAAPRRRRLRPLRARRMRLAPLKAQRTTAAPEASPPSHPGRQVPTRRFHTSEEVRRAYERSAAAQEDYRPEGRSR